MEITFKGEKGALRGLSDDLSTASGRVGKRASKAIRDTANKVAREAAQNAPVDTGELSESMEVRIFGDGRSTGITAVVAPLAWHSMWQEFGTSKMAPQPYFFPALDANADDFTKALADALDDAL